ncbi:MAG: four helix bundle protein [Omnitrophica WOR_2 bacterium RIFCSPLOWO2_12_FULL_50_9]|nr:MAG: four helix bundle protein [Omnitrophica WOR_2 bacterium RIFCSPLOWO2_12_FULL_50_9]
MRNYKSIKAFQLADDFAVEIYKVTQQFPKEELYGLTSQLRRAVVSVPTNIAEGASRQHQKDYLQFLYVARASLAETEYLLHLTNKLGYLRDELFGRIEEQKQEVAKTLFGLIEAVKREL